MKEIEHIYLEVARPGCIVVSDYGYCIKNWHFHWKPSKDTHDIGMWHIKYK